MNSKQYSKYLTRVVHSYETNKNATMNLNANPTPIGLKEILSATLRLPYTAADTQAVANYLTFNLNKGLDTQLNPWWTENSDVYLREGCLIISSPIQLVHDFVFIKLNAGKGLFGGQKSAYGSYLGSVDNDSFTPGTTFKLFGIALTSINNIYRGVGYL